MKKITLKRYVILLGMVCFFNVANAPTMEAQILASPVFDAANNLIGGVQKVVMTASRVIREEILPLKEQISKVQTFFKKASEVVNVVIRNLKMTHDLIETEKKINRLFTRSIEQIDKSENVLNKWKHRWILGQLYWESKNIFGVFELTQKENYSIMDDEGRILAIQQALKQARTVHRAMKVAIRRTNREIYKVNRQKRQLETYTKLFKKQ